jgi:hypothetical protein
MRFPRWDEEMKIVPYVKECKLIFDSTSNINPEAECQVQAGIDEDIIIIKNAVKDEVQGGEKISFVMEKVRNAPSTRGVKTIEVYT